MVGELNFVTIETLRSWVTELSIDGATQIMTAGNEDHRRLAPELHRETVRIREIVFWKTLTPTELNAVHEMVHFQPAPTCQNLCAPRSPYAVDLVAVVADQIGNIAVPPDLLQEMNVIASVLEVVLEDRAVSEIVLWILEISTTVMTIAIDVTMIDGHSGNETIPISNANRKYGMTLVHLLNPELDLRAIPYHQRLRVNDRP
jgi:hypothetical protein